MPNTAHKCHRHHIPNHNYISLHTFLGRSLTNLGAIGLGLNSKNRCKLVKKVIKTIKQTWFGIEKIKKTQILGCSFWKL